MNVYMALWGKLTGLMTLLDYVHAIPLGSKICLSLLT